MQISDLNHIFAAIYLVAYHIIVMSKKLIYQQPTLEITVLKLEQGIASGSINTYVHPETNNKMDRVEYDNTESGTQTLWFD